MQDYMQPFAFETQPFKVQIEPAPFDDLYKYTIPIDDETDSEYGIEHEETV